MPMITCNEILIVDDDKEDQVFLSDVIHELYPQLKCSFANNGEEALKHIQAEPPPPKLIFLDLNMPVLNGFGFLRDYKKTNRGDETCVVIYSTSSHPRDREIAKDLGASDYLTKLGDFDQLKFKVKGIVEKYC